MPHPRKVKTSVDIRAEAVARLAPCPANGKLSINLNSGTARAMLITLRG